MATFDFTLLFALPIEAVDAFDVLEQLEKAGCTDALLGTGETGKIGLMFSREAVSEQDATESAIADVQRAVPAAKLLSVRRESELQ